MSSNNEGFSHLENELNPAKSKELILLESQNSQKNELIKLVMESRLSRLQNYKLTTDSSIWDKSEYTKRVTEIKKFLDILQKKNSDKDIINASFSLSLKDGSLIRDDLMKHTMSLGDMQKTAIRLMRADNGSDQIETIAAKDLGELFNSGIDRLQKDQKAKTEIIRRTNKHFGDMVAQGLFDNATPEQKNAASVGLESMYQMRYIAKEYIDEKGGIAVPGALRHTWENYRDSMDIKDAWFTMSDTGTTQLASFLLYDLAPMIISGGVASAVGKGLIVTGGKTTAMLASRMPAAARYINSGTKLASTIKTTVSLGGKVILATAEATAFDTVFEGLRNQRLFTDKPNWQQDLIKNAAGFGFSRYFAGATKIGKLNLDPLSNQLIKQGLIVPAIITGVGVGQKILANDPDAYHGAWEEFLLGAIMTGAFHMSGKILEAKSGPKNIGISKLEPTLDGNSIIVTSPDGQKFTTRMTKKIKDAITSVGTVGKGAPKNIPETVSKISQVQHPLNKYSNFSELPIGTSIEANIPKNTTHGNGLIKLEILDGGKILVRDIPHGNPATGVMNFTAKKGEIFPIVDIKPIDDGMALLRLKTNSGMQESIYIDKITLGVAGSKAPVNHANIVEIVKITPTKSAEQTGIATQSLDSLVNGSNFKSTKVDSDGLTKISLDPLGLPEINIEKYKNTGKSDKQYRITGDNNMYSLVEVKQKIAEIQTKKGVKMLEDVIPEVNIKDINKTPGDTTNTINDGFQDVPKREQIRGFLNNPPNQTKWPLDRLGLPGWKVEKAPQGNAKANNIYNITKPDGTVIRIESKDQLIKKINSEVLANRKQSSELVSVKDNTGESKNQDSASKTVNNERFTPRDELRSQLRQLQDRRDELLALKKSKSSENMINVTHDADLMIVETAIAKIDRQLATNDHGYKASPKTKLSILEQSELKEKIRNRLGDNTSSLKELARKEEQIGKPITQESVNPSQSATIDKSAKARIEQEHGNYEPRNKMKQSDILGGNFFTEMESIMKMDDATFQKNFTEVQNRKGTEGNRPHEVEMYEAAAKVRVLPEDQLASSIRPLKSRSQFIEDNRVALRENNKAQTETKKGIKNIENSLIADRKELYDMKNGTGEYSKVAPHPEAIKAMETRITHGENLLNTQKNKIFAEGLPLSDKARIVAENAALRSRLKDVIGKQDPVLAAVSDDPAALANALKDPEKSKKWWLLGLIPLALLLTYCNSKDTNPQLAPPTPLDAATPQSAQDYCKSCYAGDKATIDTTRKINGRVANESYRLGVSERYSKTKDWKDLVSLYTTNQSEIRNQNPNIADNMDNLIKKGGISIETVQDIQYCIAMLDSSGTSVDSKDSQDGMLGPITTAALRTYFTSCKK